MANFFTDNDDLQYYFERGIDWTSIVHATEFGRPGADDPEAVREAVDTYRDMLEMIGKFAADELAPRAAAIDAFEMRLEDGEVVVAPETDEIFEQIKALDLHWLCIPRELGGMNSPLLTYFMTAELMARADVSTMTHFSFHGGMAMAMLAFSVREGSTKFDFEAREITETRFADFIEEIGNGDAWGTMDITEPDAGSDMAALRTRGEQDEAGNWFVTGQKIFITSGHGKYHFVIARTEKVEDPDDPFAGLGGLSFFLVPAYRDLPDGTRERLATVERVEHKLGHNGSVTAAISFERTPAHLIGKRGEGFKYMLTLMNNARLGVGFESIGLCEAAYRMARRYAAERPSMGKSIDRHEMIADYLDEMRTDIQGLRALAMAGAYHEELATKLQLIADVAPAEVLEREMPRAELEAKIEHHKATARRYTPLLKYLAAEKSVDHARRCIQIHGGNGYTKEYGAEKLLRDALVMPIYEGTSQIQSLMAMKDALGLIMKEPQRFVREAAQARWRALSARDPLERRLAKLQANCFEAQQYLVRKTATDKLRSLSDKPVTDWSRAFLKDWNPKKDFAYAMLHAERLTQMMADVAIGEVLWEQARQHADRREVLERYLERAEPRSRHLKDTIQSGGSRLLTWLAGGERPVAAAE